MDDGFERQVSSLLREEGEIHEGELERLRAFAASLTREEQGAPASGGLLIAAAALGAVILVVLAISRGPATLPGLDVGGTSDWVVRSDPRFEACGGTAEDVLAAFPMETARDFRKHFPNAGKAPELEVDEPAFVVVFSDRAPVGVAPQLPRRGESLPPASPGLPNHHDVCVLVGPDAGGVVNIYGEVDTTGMRP